MCFWVLASAVARLLWVVGGSPLASAYSQGPPYTLVSTPAPALSNSGAHLQPECHEPLAINYPGPSNGSEPMCSTGNGLLWPNGNRLL